MINSTSICAVVVTYNRLDFLKDCINSIRSQSRDLDKIIIVNNGSTDGTAEYLKEIDDEKIQIITQENCGGAGGFNTGMNAAFTQGFDWIWMMDDDVEPFQDCLENLLKFSEISKCIHPLRIFKDNQEVFKWEHYLDYRTLMPILHHNQSLQFKDFCYVNTACFEGILVHRSIVEKIGLPKREYFIAGDDTEYGILASLHTNIVYTKTAKMYRQRVSISNKIRPLQAYYEYRNLFLLKKNIKNVIQTSDTSLFFRNLSKDFWKKFKSVLFGKEYTFSEKITICKRMILGIKDGLKIYRTRT